MGTAEYAEYAETGASMPEAGKRWESRGPEGAEAGGGRKTSAIRGILFRVFRVFRGSVFAVPPVSCPYED